MTEPSGEMESLIKEIKQGQRIILLPPGIFIFSLVNVLLLGSFVTLLAPILTVVGMDWPMPQKAATQMGAIVLSLLCIAPPAILITRGKKQFQQWFKLLSLTLALSAAVLLLMAMMFGWQGIIDRAPPLYASIIISSMAAYLAQTQRYTLLTHFYYLLHRKAV